MLGVHEYLWRLVPANPILLRVVEAGGKRRRDLFVRCGYLALLILVVIFALVGSGGTVGAASLGELAKVSAKLFQQMSYLQLGLVALLAPVFTAGAITQEKDSQTYDILLATPLTNGQIVLGSLLSRLFFVIALLVSGIPIFSITQIFGGVAIRSIALSFAIAAATAFVTASIAMAIATFKVGTRRTIFSFYMLIMIFLVGGFLLDRLNFFHFDVEISGQTERSKTSWLTAIHPFLALRTLFHEQAYTPPQLAELPPELRGWPWGWYLSSPETFYVWFMFLISLVLVLPSIVLLRRLAQSTTSIKTWVLQQLRIVKLENTRKPRNVWSNPIAWREAKTKASAARASMLRYGFIAAGMVGAVVLVVMFSHERIEGSYITPASYDPTRQTLSIVEGESAPTYKVLPTCAVTLNNQPAGFEALQGRYVVTNKSVDGRRQLNAISLADVQRQLSASDTRSFLLGSVIVEFAVILLIVTNAAASTVTREKEDGSLDLLLTTPITSRYYIWGKLRGLVSYVLPLVAVPVASAFIFVLCDVIRFAKDPTGDWIVFPEAILILPGLLIIVAAFASILGMQMSLRCRTTVRAVMSSVGIVLGICGALGWCGYSALAGIRGAGEAGLVVGSFSPFTILTVLIDPGSYGGRLFAPGGDPGTGRVIVLIFSWIATGAYTLLVWTMYKSMVKNFDMTIRKQSR